MIDKKSFFSKFLFAFASQGIGTLLNFLMVVFIPLLLGILDFSFWQLFLFYNAYLFLFHLGFIDGIYLTLGGKNYKKLNFDIISSQFKILLITQIIFTVIIFFSSTFLISDINRRHILQMVSIYIVILNCTDFLNMLLQAVNRSKIFSISLIFDRLFFLVVVLVAIFLSISNLNYFIYFFIAGKVLTFMFVAIASREVVFNKSKITITSWKTFWQNQKIGIVLMTANLAGMLILGTAKFIVDIIWGIEYFGKVSFSFSIISLFLMFLTQINMILFPAIRRLGTKERFSFYLKLRQQLFYILPLLYLVYFPLHFIIINLLPHFESSLIFLMTLFPIAIFDGKMRILCLTYFNVIRKEKTLFKINVSLFVISLFTYLFISLIINDLLLMLCSIVLIYAAKATFSDYKIASFGKLKINNTIFFELLTASLFIYFVSSFKLYFAFIYFSISLVSLLIIHRLVSKMKLWHIDST